MRIDFDYTYRNSDELYDGDSRISNTPDLETTFHRYTINAAYLINEQWALNTSIPFLNGERKENGQADTKINGLGDIGVSAFWNPFNDPDHKLNGLTFQGGLTLPTGDERDQALTGLINPEVFQLGTGTYQLNLGLSYNKTIGDWNYRWNVNLSTPLDESDQGFDPASIYTASFVAQKSITDDLSLQLGTAVTYGDDDEFQGEKVVTAFTSISLKTGLTWRISPTVDASTSVVIPVYQDVSGVQLGAGPVLSVGLGYSF